MTITHASFGGHKNPKELLQDALDLDLIGVAVIAFTANGEIEIASAGLDSAEVVFAGQSLITREMCGG